MSYEIVLGDFANLPKFTNEINQSITQKYDLYGQIKLLKASYMREYANGSERFPLDIMCQATYKEDDIYNLQFFEQFDILALKPEIVMISTTINFSKGLPRYEIVNKPFAKAVHADSVIVPYGEFILNEIDGNHVITQMFYKYLKNDITFLPGGEDFKKSKNAFEKRGRSKSRSRSKSRGGSIKKHKN